METTTRGQLQVSRFIPGGNPGNPFSGFSHQKPEMVRWMVDYFTSHRIKQTLHRAAQLGVKTLTVRADRHIIRTVREYWNEGGSHRWIAQTCPEMSPQQQSIARAAAAGANSIYLHGGHMDFLLAQDRIDREVPPPLVEQIHDEENPDMLAEDLQLFQNALELQSQTSR